MTVNASEGFDFAIRTLTEADAEAVLDFMAAQPPEYLRYFNVFGTDISGVISLLNSVRRDVYGGVFWQGRLDALFSVRGWDEGFAIPTYGLAVRATQSGGTISAVAVAAGRAIATLAGSHRLMAKVHPDNISATRCALTCGFVADSTEAGTGNIIYYLDLT